MSEKPEPSSVPLYNSWDIANWLKETYGYDFNHVIYVLSRGKWYDIAEKQFAFALHREAVKTDDDDEESILNLVFDAFGDEFCVYFRE